MTTPVTSSPPPILFFLNNQGQPNVGGSVLTQVGGTNATTYQDSAGNTPLPNPIPLNSRGEISNSSGTSCQLFLASGSTYTFTVFDANGNQLYQAASVTGPGTAGTFTSILVNSDTDGLVAQLVTSGGVTGVRWNDQTGARKAEAILWGSTASPSYGMTAGSFGLNTPAGVPLTLGAGDAVCEYLDPTTKLAGFGLAPTAAQGQIQLLGSANGGIKLGNTNNTYALSLDWYEEGPWTPVLRFGGLSTGVLYATQLGTFTRIGNSVRVRMRLALSAKGSATGTATIAGLPYAAVSSTPGISEGGILGEFLSMTGLSAGTCYALGGQGGSTVLTVFVTDLTGATGTVVTRSDTAFTNGSTIDVNFEYAAA